MLGAFAGDQEVRVLRLIVVDGGGLHDARVEHHYRFFRRHVHCVK